MTSAPTFQVVSMRESHLDEVVALERQTFALPMSREGFAREMALSMAHLCVALHAGNVVGYMNYWRVDREIHILTIAVLPAFQRRGVGKTLFDAMIEQTSDAESYHLELRVSNEKALAFYRGYGFEIVGKRPRYYADNAEDAYLMSRYTVRSRQQLQRS